VDFGAGAFSERVYRYGVSGIGMVLALRGCEPALRVLLDLIGSQFTIVNRESADIARPPIEILRGVADDELAGNIVQREREMREWIGLAIDVNHRALGTGGDDENRDGAVVEQAADFDAGAPGLGLRLRIVASDDETVGPLADEELFWIGWAVEAEDVAKQMNWRCAEHEFKGDGTADGRGVRKNWGGSEEDAGLGDANAVGVGKPCNVIWRVGGERIHRGEEYANDHGDDGDFESMGLPKG